MILVLVDASFTSFYRFFATLRWYQFSNREYYEKNIKNNNKYDFSKNELFMSKYSKMYLENIESILKKEKKEDYILLFCRDDKQERLWRHKLVEDNEMVYKGERPDLKMKYNLEGVFEYTYNVLLKELKKSRNYYIKTLKFSKTEADDIIAVITLYLERIKPDQEIIIVSGDDDFTQLGRKNVSIMDYRKKELKKFNKKESEDKLRLKIIMGDKSDNISGIFPKSRKELSLKKRKELKENNKLFEEFLKLEENKDIRERYELNKKLIDFSEIPKEIKKPILEKFKKIDKLL